MDAKLLAAMAAHVDVEERASRVYRQLSAWCEWQSWVGSAALFRRESAEEAGHVQEWQDYVLDRGGMAMVGPQSPIAPGLPQDPLLTCYEAALRSEESVLGAVNATATMAEECGDRDAVRFCQHYAEIGVKQIRDLTTLVVTLRRAGADMAAMQAFDRELVA